MTKQPFQSIRGMRDIRDEDALAFEYVMSVIRQKLQSYGYQPFHPPILENTALFQHSIGEGTDVVEKEMFTFEDEGEHLCLRPEATAGMVRAVLQHGLTFGAHKLWTAGPMFRRERPQKGRYRQFHQVSVEAFGVETPEQDAEQIIFAHELWQALGIADAVTLQINTLATTDIRHAYRRTLVDYFSAQADALDDDSQQRLSKNPLRILDSKNPDMQPLIQAAPKLFEQLDQASQQHFDRVLSCLDQAGINYTINPTLVRGLDYYNHTVYEWVTESLGAQGTICGGGRYDGLAAHLGKKSTPAVGFGLGIDRVVLLMQAMDVVPHQSAVLAYFVLLDEAARSSGLVLANAVRNACPNATVLTHLGLHNAKAQFKKADQAGARFAVVIGESERLSQQATVKTLACGTQATVPFAELPDYLSSQQTKSN
ncbi:histidine--tRNA ligase [Ostreibacterium oceani]|uniref:Histidine--tRNA ligase n=1 Tax=Ostreibacterium oceani TaxID=2654998 RepID=A0A6N7EZD3_9GAMM|nr:histidine--tRNA ligase [Ostreibacterium oceani]MPV85858.1 histidine--tRNA ligase [Ostreibacterium oceani]